MADEAFLQPLGRMPTERHKMMLAEELYELLDAELVARRVSLTPDNTIQADKGSLARRVSPQEPRQIIFSADREPWAAFDVFQPA